MQKIAIFASGTGSNAEKIIQYFQAHPKIIVSLLASNNAHALALQKAKNYGVPTYIFDKNTFYETELVTQYLQQLQIDYIVLAGFLWLIPDTLIRAFPEKIINIHPALLPKYGGKGMYGMHVHQAVFQAKELETGITIHYVNEKYDEGEVIFQATCSITAEDTPAHIQQKVQALEHQYFPKVIENLLLKS